MGKKYKIVFFMRIDPDEPFEHLTYEQVSMNKEHWELFQPENIYRIGEIGYDRRKNTE